MFGRRKRRGVGTRVFGRRKRRGGGTTVFGRRKGRGGGGQSVWKKKGNLERTRGKLKRDVQEVSLRGMKILTIVELFL